MTRDYSTDRAQDVFREMMMMRRRENCIDATPTRWDGNDVKNYICWSCSCYPTNHGHSPANFVFSEPSVTPSPRSLRASAMKEIGTEGDAMHELIRIMAKATGQPSKRASHIQSPTSLTSSHDNPPQPSINVRGHSKRCAPSAATLFERGSDCIRIIATHEA
jgi:hypothetical protein